MIYDEGLIQKKRYNYNAIESIKFVQITNLLGLNQGQCNDLFIYS